MTNPSRINAKNQKNTEPIVIIGGGLMGSAAAWQLAKEGLSVILLEQQAKEYSNGSSFGEARICRSLGPKYDIWSYIHNTAVSETHQLIEYLNAHDDRHHAMEEIYTTSPVTYIYYTKKVAAAQRMLKQQSDPYEFAGTKDDAISKFGMEINDGQIVVRERKKYTGTINPKVLISKLHRAIELSGNQIHYEHKVTDLGKTDDGYAITVEQSSNGIKKEILGKQIVTAGGPYLGTLLIELAPYTSDLIKAKRVFLGFLKIDPTTYASLTETTKKQLFESFPILDMGPDHMFAMIEKIDEHGIPIIKVGGHFIREPIENLDEVWAKEVTENELDWSIDQIHGYLKMVGLSIEKSQLIPVDGYSCVYSLTASEVAFVTNLVDSKGQLDPNLVMIGGMSGVGAKGALTYGMMAKNLLLKKDLPEDAMYQRTIQAMGVDRILQHLDIIP